MSDLSAVKTPVVENAYYVAGQTWQDERSGRILASRNVWRGFALLEALAVSALAIGMTVLLPLKTTEVVTLLVDKATGFTEIARPLEDGGPLSQREAVTAANIVRYLRARETFDPKGLRDNYDLALLLSTASAARDHVFDFEPGNSNNLMKKWGPDTTISIHINSVNFLTDAWRSDSSAYGTAAVRFETNRKGRERDAGLTEHWVGNVKFRYTSEPLKNEYRFDNPLGFQVVEYRRDQESITQNTGTIP